MATRRAVIVGVPSTTYYGGSFAALPGATRDAQLMTECLSARGFPDKGIVSFDGLRGRVAETGAVQDALTTMVSATGPGDLSVFYFNGHGFQFPDLGGDEPVSEPVDPQTGNRRDESLVCAEYAIADDWFSSALWPKAQPEANFVFVVDACHAETAVLKLDRNRSFWEKLFGKEPPAPVVREDTSFSRVVLAACADTEKSVALLSFEAGGGVVTLSMLRELRKHPLMSYRDLWPAVAQDVYGSYASQGAGMPVMRYSGPDGQLLNTTTFQLPGGGP